MIRISLALFLVTAFSAVALPPPITPDQVLVVYNKNSAESKNLAESYAIYRDIPDGNLFGLDTTEKATIDRATYLKTIRQPLRDLFDAKSWWTMGRDASTGQPLPTKSKIRCLALMKGVPLRIQRGDVPASEAERTDRLKKNNEASVDSELMVMGLEKHPIGGAIPNPYFNQDKPATNYDHPYLMLVGRLDAISYDQCKRVVLDSLAAEEKGLWGRSYVDFSKKSGGYKQGEDWMENIAKTSRKIGMPTVTDRFANTFPTNYPMTDAAVYFGWYTFHRNGPFLNPEMEFKPGAIAVHIHSLSAAQMLNPAKNWSAAMIDRGAAATVGNTYEPFLGMSHHLDVFFDRLSKGYTLVEAGSMSINVVSWQAVIIGDPLYRPFKKAATEVKDFKEDAPYKAIRFAVSKWSDPEKREGELRKAGANLKSGAIFEAFGFEALEADDFEEAAKSFMKAGELFKDPADQLRQELNLVELDRRKKEPAAAIKRLQAAARKYKDLPEAKAVTGLLNILNPPAPPPAKKK